MGLYASKRVTMLHNEKELIERITRGEIELFAHIAEHYAQAVHTLVVRIVGNREDAEEVTQDIFLRIFDNLALFNFKCAFSTWLYRIAYNHAISFTRRKRLPHYPIDDNRLRSVSDDYVEQMEAVVDNERQIESLTQAITRLDAEERALITLFYYEERSVEECAEIMSQSENNIKVRLHRIRKKLYILLRDETK